MGISYICRYTQVGMMSERVWQRGQAGHVHPIFLPRKNGECRLRRRNGITTVENGEDDACPNYYYTASYRQLTSSFRPLTLAAQILLLFSPPTFYVRSLHAEKNYHPGGNRSAFRFRTRREGKRGDVAEDRQLEVCGGNVNGESRA